jgi:hypothetical protein
VVKGRYMINVFPAQKNLSPGDGGENRKRGEGKHPLPRGGRVGAPVFYVVEGLKI